MQVILSFLCPDEDDEAERNAVPLTPLNSFFSDSNSLKQQKKKKAKKMKEGKMPKVKKRKKEVSCNSHSTPLCHDLRHSSLAGILAPAVSCIVCFANHHLFDVPAIGSKV